MPEFSMIFYIDKIMKIRCPEIFAAVPFSEGYMVVNGTSAKDIACAEAFLEKQSGSFSSEYYFCENMNCALESAGEYIILPGPSRHIQWNRLKEIPRILDNQKLLILTELHPRRYGKKLKCLRAVQVSGLDSGSVIVFQKKLLQLWKQTIKDSSVNAFLNREIFFRLLSQTHGFVWLYEMQMEYGTPLGDLSQDIFSVNRAYDAIRNTLMEDAEIWKRFCNLYWHQKFVDYRWVLSALSGEARERFLLRMAREFRRGMVLGQIKHENFTFQEWRYLKRLITAVDDHLTKIKGNRIVYTLRPLIPKWVISIGKKFMSRIHDKRYNCVVDKQGEIK